MHNVCRNFKGRMTIIEGRKALRELIVTTDDEEKLAHYKELDRLQEDEDFLETVKENADE